MGGDNVTVNDVAVACVGEWLKTKGVLDWDPKDKRAR